MGLFDFLKGGKKQDSAAMPTDNTATMPMSADVPAPNVNTGEAAAMPATPADPAASMVTPEAPASSDGQTPATPATPAADGSMPASDGSSSDGQPPVAPAA